MFWLSTFGDRFSLFNTSFFIRNFARIATVFVALFAAPVPQNEGPNRLSPDDVLMNAPSATETLALWMQPSTAAAAPRQRKRARATRAQEKKTDVASETSPEQAGPVLAPLTPYIQIWPQAHAVKNDAPEAMTQLSSHDFMRVTQKSDRLGASSTGEEEVVQADELSELDRAIAPGLQLHPDGLPEVGAQPAALVTTDGRSALDSGDTPASANRFSAFAESVKAIPQAPWFDSILIVLGGAFAAFVAARIFMRA